MTEHFRDLQAAQKTISVLKGKVLTLYSGEDDSEVARQLKTARAREEANRRRRELLELRQAELQMHSERLEKEVLRRTREMHDILDNVTFGFLLLDSKLAVLDGYTRSCDILFEREASLLGQRFQDLVPTSHPLSYELAYSHLFEDILPEEVSIGQLQTRFALPSGRVLRVEPRVIRDQAGSVARVLMTVSDISALEAARRESDVHRVLVTILRAKTAFRGFLRECKHLLEEAAAALNEDDQEAARRALHTIKGNAASYDLSDLVRHIHAQEEKAEISRGSIEGTHAVLRGFLETHFPVLEIDYDETDSEKYDISDAQVERLKSLVSRDDRAAPSLRRWTAELAQKPARELVGPLEEFVGRLAARLQKQVRFEFIGGDTLVDGETLRPAFRLLTHLIRNSLDHGIEAAEARGDKPVEGRLSVCVESLADDYAVTVTDDGRGIDGELLVRKAVAAGRVSPEQARSLSVEEKQALCFLDGLSSTAQATDVSGRGVGMSAVKEEIERADGLIELTSQL